MEKLLNLNYYYFFVFEVVYIYKKEMLLVGLDIYYIVRFRYELQLFELPLKETKIKHTRKEVKMCETFF